MIMVSISGEERQINGDPDEQWIAQRIGRRREAGEQVWVRVRIDIEGCGLIVSTPGAPSIGFGGGALNGCQRRIADLWNESGLGAGHVTPAPLIAFLMRLRRIL